MLDWVCVLGREGDRSGKLVMDLVQARIQNRMVERTVCIIEERVTHDHPDRNLDDDLGNAWEVPVDSQWPSSAHRHDVSKQVEDCGEDLVSEDVSKALAKLFGGRLPVFVLKLVASRELWEEVWEAHIYGAGSPEEYDLWMHIG